MHIEELDLDKHDILIPKNPFRTAVSLRDPTAQAFV
jgi:hypothetical protein